MREVGRHFVFELFGCDAKALDDLKAIEWAMERGAEDAGVKVVGKVFHKFSPQGVTGVVVIAESHLSIHTWPELGYAAVDLFTCNTNTDPMKAFQRLADLLKPKSMSVVELKRGLFMGDTP
ncbi:MAG: adenosylmethionine decarboxylase [Candidatus Methanomethyliales bacterium]|nr:adenosylmethionine decarboxylase [Candidatus Methanomethylicales archaeon]